MKLDAFTLLLLLLGLVMFVVGLALSWRLIIELFGLLLAFMGIVLLIIVVARR